MGCKEYTRLKIVLGKKKFFFVVRNAQLTQSQARQQQKPPDVKIR
jgi:hypothetical protein